MTENNATVVFASDHAGFALKETLISFVKVLGFEVEDVGAHTYDAEDDYPDFISLAAEKVSLHPASVRAVVIGGSGQGEAIVCNRFKNVRAAVYNAPNLDIVRLSREHNDANILSLGARFLSEDEAKEAVKLWLGTPFPKDKRHQRRIEKIEAFS